MNSNEQHTIYIVDDHDMLQIGLKNFLESKSDSKVIGTAKTIDSTKALLDSQLPDLIIIDVELANENGFDLAAYIKTTFPELKIVMYSMHDENDYILKAKELKIDGYISKASESEEFLKCIKNIYSGNSYSHTIFHRRCMYDRDRSGTEVYKSGIIYTGSWYQ